MTTLPTPQLLSDWLLWLTMLLFLLLAWTLRRQPHIRSAWQQLKNNPSATAAGVILLFYGLIALTDSLHFTHTAAQSGLQPLSLLDKLLGPTARSHEQSYSAPLSHLAFVKQSQINAQGQLIRLAPPLQHIDEHAHPASLIVRGLCLGTALFLCLWLLLAWRDHRHHQQAWRQCLSHYRPLAQWSSQHALLYTLGLIMISSCVLMTLEQHLHVFGTDKIGQDVFYQSLKSVRTGLIIGILTTVVMSPFAIILGIAAGYMGGWIDDAIQYLYTTLSSIPGVLLISASILVLQVSLDRHAGGQLPITARSDIRLIALCLILGLTSWASLCRILRAETLKIRALDYITAARSLGSPAVTIMRQHILPNVFHLVIITLALDFSLLILAEAVLSYVGVGVDPTTLSWGNMINSARLELAREPIIWWPLAAALITMFGLVLAANRFADALRDALDPKIRQQPVNKA